MGFSDGAGMFGWNGAGGLYRYILFFSGYEAGLWVRIGTIDGCFGGMAKVLNISIVFRYLNGQ